MINFKLALRHFAKSKLFLIISIVGLALGMMCFTIMSLYIENELSFDRDHPGAERIYRVNQRSEFPNGKRIGSYTPFEVGRALGNKFPGVEQCARTYKLFYSRNLLVKYNDNQNFESKYLLADPEFFDIFSFKTLFGDPNSLLNSIQSVVISEQLSKKFFYDKNPVGELLSIGDKEFYISGVVRVPDNTDFQYDLFLPLMAYKDDIDYGWRGEMYRTYIKLYENVEPYSVEENIWALQKENIPEETEKTGIVLQPIRDIHLYKADGKPLNIVKYLKILGISGILILLIACINYANLSTSIFMKRSKETGIMRLMGAA